MNTRHLIHGGTAIERNPRIVCQINCSFEESFFLKRRKWEKVTSSSSVKNKKPKGTDDPKGGTSLHLVDKSVFSAMSAVGPQD